MLYYIDGGRKKSGAHSDLWGNCSDLWGDCSGLWGNCSDLWGDCSGLWGDCSGLWGNCSRLRGDCSGLWGACSDFPKNCTLRTKNGKPLYVQTFIQYRIIVHIDTQFARIGCYRKSLDEWLEIPSLTAVEIGLEPENYAPIRDFLSTYK